VNGLAALVADGRTYEVERLSEGRFSGTLPHLYEVREQFRRWAASTTLEGGMAVDLATLGPPSPGPRQVFGIGLNYREHALEAGISVPEVPLVFTKFASSITGPAGDIPLPTTQVDWEVELAVVIGRIARNVAPAAAWDFVAGVTAAQDVCARDVQMRPADIPQFSLGKSFPGFTPLGPFLVTPVLTTVVDGVGQMRHECVTP
jgi:2-keto-4-pentenoate hydratase/2-oxohepta-3-ene-1,7-dioic acid hydratase in catechol pathway